MAYGKPNPGSNSGGGDDNYADAATSTGTSKPEEKSEDGETALLPKSICPDMKPGDEMVLKIVRVTDDQYEVAYAPKKDSKEESTEPVDMEKGSTLDNPGSGQLGGMYD